MNKNAQALAKLRNEKLTPDQRAAIASKAGTARWAGKSLDERAEHMRLMGKAPKKPRKKKDRVIAKTERKMTLTHKTGKNRQMR